MYVALILGVVVIVAASVARQYAHWKRYRTALPSTLTDQQRAMLAQLRALDRDERRRDGGYYNEQERLLNELLDSGLGAWDILYLRELT